MKTRTALASLACLVAGVAIGAALDAHMGTWKLNESKSKFAAGVQISADGKTRTVTTTTTDASGKKTKSSALYDKQ